MKAVQGWFGLVAVLAVVTAHADGDWQFAVGGVSQWGMKMNTHGPSPTIPHNYSIPPGVLPPADGSAGVGLTDPNGQTYVDGYVRRDWYMDAPGASGSDLSMTWNWHYNNANQYNSVDHTLAFHRQTDESATSSGDEEFSGTGVEFSAKRHLLSCCGLDVGVDLDMDWFPDLKAAQTRSQASRFTTYYYSDNWTVVNGLPTGYQGPDYNYNNPSTPSDSGNQNTPPITYAPIRVTDTLEQTIVATKADLNRIRAGFGPTLSVPLTSRLRVFATPQFTVNMVYAEVKRSQTTTSTDEGSHVTTTVSSSEVSQTKTAVLGGVLLSAGLEYGLSDNWTVGASIGHEWVPGNLHVTAGPDVTDLKLGGGEAKCYLGYKF